MYPTSLLELFSLHQRVVLITGATGGIGQTLALGLAQAGATVALSGRSTDKLAELQTKLQREIQAEGQEVTIFPADLSEHSEVQRLVDAVIERFGRIDVLVNCAGTNVRQPILEVEPETYDQIMETNLRSTYFLSQLVARDMMRHDGGKIIHIGSLTAAVGLADVSVYGMTKAALSQLTKTMAVEFAEHGICVNCICPGFIATELTEPLWSSPTRRRWMLERIPLRRPGEPRDIVGILIYLSSPASDYTTGQTVYIDGGFLAGSQW